MLPFTSAGALLAFGGQPSHRPASISQRYSQLGLYPKRHAHQFVKQCYKPNSSVLGAHSAPCQMAEFQTEDRPVCAEGDIGETHWVALSLIDLGKLGLPDLSSIIMH
jgi:hypothetical protein